MWRLPGTDCGQMIRPAGMLGHYRGRKCNGGSEGEKAGTDKADLFSVLCSFVGFLWGLFVFSFVGC